MKHLEYAKNVFVTALLSPSEFFDRLAGQIAIRREAGQKLPGYKEGSSKDLKELIDRDGDFDALGVEFEKIWNDTAETLSKSEHILGKGYDAGRALAEWAYILTRIIRPEVAIETGVARGITSRVVLEAMQKNKTGHLFSIDLPPLLTRWVSESASAVVPSLQPRWTYIRGASRRHLPALLHRVGSIPLFIHDSLHTFQNMKWELETVWGHVIPGGYILCDDIEDNMAFSDFVTATKANYIIRKEPLRSGYIGAIRR